MAINNAKLKNAYFALHNRKAVGKIVGKIKNLCFITQRPNVNFMYPKSLTTVYKVSCNCIDIQPMHQTYRMTISVVENTFSSMSVILFDSRCLQRKRYLVKLTRSGDVGTRSATLFIL